MKKQTKKKSKKENKETEVERAKRLHQLSHAIFDESHDVCYESMDVIFRKFVDKYGKDLDDNEKYETIVSPVVSSLTSTLATFLYHMDYSLGESLEMISYFYYDIEKLNENMDQEEETKLDTSDPTTVEELIQTVQLTPSGLDKKKMN